MKRDILTIRSDECHFPVTDGPPHVFCCDPVQPGSSYCAPHHARCHAGFGRPWKSVEHMMITLESSVVRTRQGRSSEPPVTVPVDVQIRGDR